MENDFFVDYMDMDEYQRQLIDRKIDKSMVVTGSAGSGKSVIALHKAKQIAQLTNDFAIVVFTKTLRQYFEDGIKQLGIKNVFHYNGWNKQKVKYLIVDEIQDFTQKEIEEMKEFAEICFFFGDTAQSIMGFKEGGTQDVETTAFHMRIAPLPLYFNYRLTIENAEVAKKVLDDTLGTQYKRSGEKPMLLNLPTFDEQLDEIIRIVQNRSLNNVGILMPFNTKLSAHKSHIGDLKLSVEYVHEYLLSKGIPNEFKYSADKSTSMDLDFHSTNIKIMTWHCAKGLQFKDVFIPGCYINEEDKRKSLYVAITRGSERLYILHSNKLSIFFDDVDTQAWNSREEVEDI